MISLGFPVYKDLAWSGYDQRWQNHAIARINFNLFLIKGFYNFFKELVSKIIVYLTVSFIFLYPNKYLLWYSNNVTDKRLYNANQFYTYTCMHTHIQR